MPGFYNETLTPAFARSVNKALYLDVDCDIYVSSIQVLTWIFEHDIPIRNVTVIYFDELDSIGQLR